MKLRALVVAGAAAALMGGIGAFVLPVAASGRSRTHTLKFTSVALRQANFSKVTAGAIAKDVNDGKTIGFDQIYVTFHPRTRRTSAGVALETNGGFIYGTINLNSGTSVGSVVHGKVMGGTGKFSGATGTITGRQVNKIGTREAVSITYTG